MNKTLFLVDIFYAKEDALSLYLDSKNLSYGTHSTGESSDLGYRKNYDVRKDLDLYKKGLLVRTGRRIFIFETS